LVVRAWEVVGERKMSGRGRSLVVRASKGKNRLLHSEEVVRLIMYSINSLTTGPT